MKKIIVMILLVLNLYSTEIPFDANFRIKSQENNYYNTIYSTRLNLIEFKESKIVIILEQEYYSGIKPKNNNMENRYYFKYLYYF